MAFGWLGIMPEVWYDMLIEDFVLMSNGYKQKREYEEDRFRRVAWITHASFASKAVPMNTLWPIGERDKPITQDDLRKRSEDIMKKVRLNNKLLEEKEKRGRAAKNSN
jgi:hypothetical protein